MQECQSLGRRAFLQPVRNADLIASPGSTVGIAPSLALSCPEIGRLVTCGLSRSSDHFVDAAFGFVVKRGLLELERCGLPKTRGRSDLVVLASEVFDQDLRIDTVLEPLQVQALVERFVRTMLPWLSMIDVRLVDILPESASAAPPLKATRVRCRTSDAAGHRTS